MCFASPRLSRWSCSAGKRIFDLGCVLAAAPLLVPVCLLIGLAVCLTSRGPVLFRQQRVGRNGRAFTILKFRTMPHLRDHVDRPVVTTHLNQRFTSVGQFLRRWKLDELPQILNVLCGEMSLVGPRPKLPEHQTAYLNCRPGITGAVTLPSECVSLSQLV
ncbi:MAG: sugar transferase [Acidobacteriaceae bacterium]